MKTIITLLVFTFTISTQAQQKQYRSAETGRYVSKSTATKSPSTTYSTTRSKK